MQPTLRRAGAAAILVFVLAVGCGGGDEPEPKKKAETIPLKSICVTFKQDGAKVVKRGEQRPTPGPALEKLWEKYESGASNVFLVYGDDVGEAASATVLMLTGGRSGDVPARARGDKRQSKSVWLVGYLGIFGSEPPAWAVKSAEKRGAVIRLSVEMVKREKSTEDRHQYVVFVPLGELKEGTYTLELFQTQLKEVTLMRRVTVKP